MKAFTGVVLAAAASTSHGALAAPPAVRQYVSELDESFRADPAVLTPQPSEYTADADVPKSFSWANVNGRSYVTKMLNQHIPQYCGSCWAHGSMSALADRVKIAKAAKGDLSGPDVNLAIQTLLNCGKRVAGTCHGGHPAGAYEYVLDHGIPYDTCQVYKASDSEGCDREDVCKTCFGFGSENCWAVAEGKDEHYDEGYNITTNGYPYLNISEHGFVAGESAMKAEILRRGPIACGIDAVPLLSYSSGVVSSSEHSIDHVVSVVGWGTEKSTGEDYWVVRNSWGEYWGERGWAKVARGKNSLGIENDCFWAQPESWGTVSERSHYDQANVVNFYKSLLTSSSSSHQTATSLDQVEHARGNIAVSWSDMTTSRNMLPSAVVALVAALGAFYGGRRYEQRRIYGPIE